MSLSLTDLRAPLNYCSGRENGYMAHNHFDRHLQLRNVARNEVALVAAPSGQGADRLVTFRRGKLTLGGKCQVGFYRKPPPHYSAEMEKDLETPL